jgi:hypothetical protein
MVKGFESFREWFTGYEMNYVVIGGTACDVLLSEAGEDFRVTKDIDMVLIVEALNAEFGNRFWEYVQMGGYENRLRSTGKPEYYRFTKPKASGYPAMIELFSRRIDGISLPSEALLTPLPIEDDVSSLSAILLDDEYYNFLLNGVTVVDGIPILDVAYLIPFKAKAWLDLSTRRAGGEQVDSKNIRKHANDIINLSALLLPEYKLSLPQLIMNDMRIFFRMIDEPIKYIRVAEAYDLTNKIQANERI